MRHATCVKSERVMYPKRKWVKNYIGCIIFLIGGFESSGIILGFELMGASKSNGIWTP